MSKTKDICRPYTKGALYKMSERCKGCRIIDDEQGVCEFVRHSDECPCIECLVKVICETACKEYNAFYHKYIMEIRSSA